MPFDGHSAGSHFRLPPAMALSSMISDSAGKIHYMSISSVYVLWLLIRLLNFWFYHIHSTKIMDTITVPKNTKLNTIECFDL